MNNGAGFQALLHVWSTKRYLQSYTIEHPGIHIYTDKNVTGNVVDSDFATYAKRKYMTERGIPWNLSNKKFRDTLSELEELLEKQFIACIAWTNSQAFQIILSNGVIISVIISCDSPDIERIFIDRSLTKRHPDYISDAIVHDNFVLMSFLEKPQLLLVNFTAGKSTSVNDWRDGDRLNTMDPKYSVIDLPAPKSGGGMRAKRTNCVCNKEVNLVCVWWRGVGREVGGSSVVWLSLLGISCVYTMDIITEMTVEGSLLDAIFSHSYPNQLLTIEQTQSSSSKFLIDACTYELVGKKTSRIYSTTLATKSEVICQARSYMQDKMVLVCVNGTLVLWDESKRVPHITKSPFLSDHVTWHPNDVIFLLSNQQGNIAVYDIALNCLCVQLLNDMVDTTSDYLKLSPYFFSQPTLKLVSWSCDTGVGPAPEAIGCCEDILLVFDKGPVCLLRLELGICTRGVIGPVELLCEYIKCDQLKEAVALLNSLNWNSACSTCFQCLVLLTDHLFRLPYSFSREECLENTLGSFYSPKQPLFRDVILQYRDDISRIARRFFHYLLRRKRFKKSYLLAVDIGSKDLFMDIHYLALNVGDTELADASRRRAFDIHLKGSNVNLVNDAASGSDYTDELATNFSHVALNAQPLANSSGLHPVERLERLSQDDEIFQLDDSGSDPQKGFTSSSNISHVSDSTVSSGRTSRNRNRQSAFVVDI